MDPTPPRDNLSEREAAERASLISDVHYGIRLHLAPAERTYRGDVTIHFAYSGAGDVFLDHAGNGVALIEINGEAAALDIDTYRITLPGEALGSSNVVRVVYEHDYDHTGDGFHSFSDPDDGRTYLYTNFEPFAAHHLFPCFDQPDIKAEFRLTVDAPHDWTVISNTPIASEDADAYGMAARVFEPTALISTYLFGVMAGHWHVRMFDHNGIALGLYCRHSMADLLAGHEEEIIEVTRQGLDFYAEYFGVPYAFGKYDQIFAPEFNIGAMENPGAVTINDALLFRDAPTDHQRLNRADLILHEMAHMWFGDLVTMRWWNDLWLNESFATYMSHVALSATRFAADSWLAFNAGVKAWAYQQDQLVTTHPVAGPVPDTEATRQNFDGITYGKGAALIQQLVTTAGEDVFRAAMHDYFVKYQFANATLADFLDAIGSHASGFDAAAWSEMWIGTAGLNTLELQHASNNDGLDFITITQTAPEDHPTLRHHTLSVAVVDDADADGFIHEYPVTISTARADILAAPVIPAPVFMMPNHDDRAYAAVILDDASAGWLLARMDTLADPLMRLVGWQSLWHMVREQRLAARTYLTALRLQLPLESSLPILSFALATAAGAVTRYVADHAREAEQRLMFVMCYSAAGGVAAASNPDLRLTWLRQAAQYAFTEHDLDQLDGMPDLDQAMRWTLAVHASAAGLPIAEAMRDTERERDSSDRGLRAYLSATASAPDGRVKADVWAASLDSGYGSLQMTEAAMSGFHWWSQRDLLDPWVEPFFETAPGVFRDRDHAFASAWFTHMFPRAHVALSVLTRAHALDDAVRDELPALSRMLREEMDRLDRALRCQVYDAASYQG